MPTLLWYLAPMVVATIGASAPYVAAFLLVIISVWIIATYILGKQFAELTSKTQPQSNFIQEEKPAPIIDLQGAKLVVEQHAM